MLEMCTASLSRTLPQEIEGKIGGLVKFEVHRGPCELALLSTLCFRMCSTVHSSPKGRLGCRRVGSPLARRFCMCNVNTDIHFVVLLVCGTVGLLELSDSEPLFEQCKYCCRLL